MPQGLVFSPHLNCNIRHTERERERERERSDYLNLLIDIIELSFLPRISVLLKTSAMQIIEQSIQTTFILFVSINCFISISYLYNTFSQFSRVILKAKYLQSQDTYGYILFHSFNIC